MCGQKDRLLSIRDGNAYPTSLVLVLRMQVVRTKRSGWKQVDRARIELATHGFSGRALMMTRC